jgi:hypothetical protein
MDHLKKVDWEALIIDEGRRQRPQKSHQKSYRPFSQIKSTFRLLLLSEPLKVRVLYPNTKTVHKAAPAVHMAFKCWA